MRVQCYSQRIGDLCKEYILGKIILNPPYQRRPAWPHVKARTSFVIGRIAMKYCTPC